MPRTTKTQVFLRNLRKHWSLLMLMVPGLLYLIINNYLPIYGLTIAFRKINYAKGVFQSDWINPIWKNFKFLFKTRDAWIITRNTLAYNAVFIVLGLIFSVSLALMLNEIRSKRFAKLYQTSMILPHLISYVIVAYLVYALLATDNGFLNNSVLPVFGQEPVRWYADVKKWPGILIIVNLWKTAGYSSIVYLASIAGIDTEFYEAAEIDGASRMQQVRLITLPLITPTIITMTLLSIGRIFYSDFGLFYQVPMDAGILYNATQTIDTYVYRGLLKLGDVAMSSAAGFYQSIVGFLLVFIANAITRRINQENALF
ncbi:MAG: sugar ABC transporter permease [Clostridiales bacterium]|nr:sugar ABC transporter permease [Clostridiales bacterium]